MDGTELRPDKACLQTFPKLPLWIIEYVWAHKTMEIQEVVDPSNWPEVDSQPLSLKDSWRLRVASAEVYSIVKNRDVKRFERVMGFLEATYRLLPRLVAPIKHMKIMFGLKTMVIMRMLRERRGMVDTVLKISQFFPRKLPQYQGQCSQHEMFLMRKNQLDFKALAQSLAMNKTKLEDYIKNQMEEQYGEHYAQKVEDRLLQYLQELETALPGDTYIDMILKKESPVTGEEKLLLEVITSDSANIASTLKKLLHSDAASCRPGSISESSAHRRNGLETQLSKSVLHGSSSEALLNSMEADQDVLKDGLLLLENDNVADVSRPLKTDTDGEVVRNSEKDSSDEEKEEIGPRSRGCVQEAPSSPQFCSKHQRWVRSILQECPDECSEELLLQANVSSSPPLLQSSSSATSSQDLTPSGIVPCPPDQQLSLDLLRHCTGLVKPEQFMKAPTTFCTRLPDFNVSGSPMEDASTSTPQGVQPRRESKTRGPARPCSTAVSTAVSTASNACLAVRSETSRAQRAPLKLTWPIQALLLQSKLRQPYVSLNRLSAQECYRVTQMRSSTSCLEAVVQASSDDKDEDRREEEEDDADSSFDVNTLYSDSPSSDSEDTFYCDPEYKPCFKKKRLLSE